jgi:hypothetical protein
VKRGLELKQQPSALFPVDQGGGRIEKKEILREHYS